MSTVNVAFVNDINHIAEEQYRCICDDYPFTQYSFLKALEDSGSVGKDRGWLASHIMISLDDEIIGFMPSYIKLHSWGEYVFDWSWAEAYERLNQQYYPKLVSAIPFTPCSGPRLCLKPNLPSGIHQTLVHEVQQLCKDNNLSSWHILFTQNKLTQTLSEQGLSVRQGLQYHWFNNNYKNFDDFLADCTARKRKDLRKERKKVYEQGFSFKTLAGNDLNESDWDLFYYFYQTTYAKRSGHGGYLSREFFSEIGRTMANQLVLVFAYLNNKPIAGALNFKSNDTLYGRYWGCLQEFDGLHFETCYYQGIDYCITHNLKKFDAGAQGEHKIQRGFQPTPTQSCHWLKHDSLNNAVRNFIEQEACYIDEQRDTLAKKLPFKQKN